MVRTTKYKYFFIASDLIIFSLMLYIFLSASLTMHFIEVKREDYYTAFFLISILLLILFLIYDLNNLYNIQVILIRSAHTTAIIKSYFYLSVIIIPFSIIFTDAGFYRTTFLITIFLLIFILLSYLLRVEILSRIFSFLKKNGFRIKVLIVGDGKPGRILAAKLDFENSPGISIIGFLDNQKTIGENIINGIKVLGRYDDVHRIVHEYHADEIIIAIDTQDYEELLGKIDFCKEEKITVKITSDLFNIIPQKIYTEKYADISVIDVSHSFKYWIILKRLFDLIASISGVILFSPLFIIIALLVKLSSKGPVIYSQIRIGKYGKPFKFFKFRTMSVYGEDDKERREKMLRFMKSNDSDSSDMKIKSDWRITKIGRLLRKTSLDEIPQLFNVIKGDMSLVGPRPCLVYEFENYDSWQKRRLNVLPGCTGIWQVIGRSSVSFKDSVVLDLYYVNNISPWMDLQLLLKTVPVMLFGKGGG